MEETNARIPDRKLKLLLMVPMLHQGGFERVCVETARLLASLADVTILIFSDRDINYDVTGLSVVNIDVPARKGKLQKALNVLKRVRRVRAAKRSGQYDAAYSFGSSANLVNVLSRTTEKVVTGLRCQTDLESRREVELFCRRSDAVLSCSREIVQQLERDFHYSKSVYIYNPLDAAGLLAKSREAITDFPFPEELAKPSHHIVVSMGRDDYIKGNWHLIKAFSLVKRDIPDAKLLILGAGSYEGNKKLAQDLGIRDSVAFPGVRKNPFPYVAAGDLYVLPSNHEGFPNALLEAMALHKPVIAADCRTGPREIVLSPEEYEDLNRREPDGGRTGEVIDGTYGVLVPDMSEVINNDAGQITDEDRTLACAMVSVLGDDIRLRHFARASEERAADFAPEHYRDSLLRILCEIADT